MGIWEYLWVSVEICEYPWESVDIHDYSWVSVNVCNCPISIKFIIRYIRFALNYFYFMFRSHCVLSFDNLCLSCFFFYFFHFFSLQPVSPIVIIHLAVSGSCNCSDRHESFVCSCMSECIPETKEYCNSTEFTVRVATICNRLLFPHRVCPLFSRGLRPRCESSRIGWTRSSDRRNKK